LGGGGRGRAYVQACRGQNIVALCDVDPGHAAATFNEYPKAATYADYRQMLDRESDIEAVIIATLDHTHAVIAMEAMRRGKHVLREAADPDRGRGPGACRHGSDQRRGHPDGEPRACPRRHPADPGVDRGRCHWHRP